MTTSPASSPSRSDSGRTSVVATKAGAGSFCRSRWPATQSVSPLVAAGTAGSRSAPPTNDHDDESGFDGHCHCSPGEGPSNSSLAVLTVLELSPDGRRVIGEGRRVFEGGAKHPI